MGRDRPVNPFRRGSIAWSVMEGGLQGEFDGLPGWEDLTVSQIGEVLAVPRCTVDTSIGRIKMGTGYAVPHAITPSGWAARNARRREAGK